MIRCNRCGEQNNDRSNYCKRCGAPLMEQKNNGGSLLENQRTNMETGKEQVRKKRRSMTAVGIVAVLSILLIMVFVMIVTNHDNKNMPVSSNIQITDSDSNEMTDDAMVNQTAETMTESTEQKVEINYEDEVARICESIKETYGVADGQWFNSCDQGVECEMPESSAGYISHNCQDINHDGMDELFVTYIDAQNWTLYIRMYQMTDEGLILKNELPIDEIDNFSMIECGMFRDSQSDTWYILSHNYLINSDHKYTLKLFKLGNELEVTQQTYDNWLTENINEFDDLDDFLTSYLGIYKDEEDLFALAYTDVIAIDSTVGSDSISTLMRVYSETDIKVLNK